MENLGAFAYLLHHLEKKKCHYYLNLCVHMCVHMHFSMCTHNVYTFKKIMCTHTSTHVYT